MPHYQLSQRRCAWPSQSDYLCPPLFISRLLLRGCFADNLFMPCGSWWRSSGEERNNVVNLSSYRRREQYWAASYFSWWGLSVKRGFFDVADLKKLAPVCINSKARAIRQGVAVVTADEIRYLHPSTTHGSTPLHPIDILRNALFTTSKL